jgi:hypothetical protein
MTQFTLLLVILLALETNWLAENRKIYLFLVIRITRKSSIHTAPEARTLPKQVWSDSVLPNFSKK